MTSADTERRARPDVQLAEVVAAIALAADLGTGQPLDHVLRSCVIATRFADHLGVTQEERDATYWTTLFLTAGCTGVSYEMSILFGDDIAFRAGASEMAMASPFGQVRFLLKCAGSNRGFMGRTRVRAGFFVGGIAALEESLLAHCAVSARMAERLGLGDEVAGALRQTFAQWDGKGLPRGVGGEDIRLASRIANVANMVEVVDREQGVDGTRVLLRHVGGSEVDPHLAAEWVAVADAVLEGIDLESSWERVLNDQPAGRGPLTEDELDDALELLADYADLKSPWFTGHSRGVAYLAVESGRHLGLPEPELTVLRRAALVHDLGRNGIANSIWDKPAELSETETERVRLHAYYVDRMLNRAGGLAVLAEVASAAHERSGGSGYPRAIGGASVPLLARVLAAADTYHALREDRPHRPAWPRADAEAELRRMARAGELDGSAVDAVLAAAGHPVRHKPTAPAGLTPREVEVLVLAARGATTKAVARSLGIAPKTAGNHIERIYTKIGVSSRAEAAMFAMQHGLVGHETLPQL